MQIGLTAWVKGVALAVSDRPAAGLGKGPDMMSTAYAQTGQMTGRDGPGVKLLNWQENAKNIGFLFRNA